MIPKRLLRILESCESEDKACFPPTEVFNEGWMLRLVLDAIGACSLPDHSLRFMPNSKWFSEARLNSPFRPRFRQDPLGEGFTNADAVIGHFDFRPATNVGMRLVPDAHQFVVVEAKMFSNLSGGTKNAPLYNQAARNVACMAETIARSGLSLDSLETVGFFIVAPDIGIRRERDTNLERFLDHASICATVNQRIQIYEELSRKEANDLREWEKNYFRPLVDRLFHEGQIAVLRWEDSIDAIGAADREWGAELTEFYKRCLSFAPLPKKVAH
jgi:hypothetical protein